MNEAGPERDAFAFAGFSRLRGRVPGWSEDGRTRHTWESPRRLGRWRGGRRHLVGEAFELLPEVLGLRLRLEALPDLLDGLVAAAEAEEDFGEGVDEGDVLRVELHRALGEDQALAELAVAAGGEPGRGSRCWRGIKVGRSLHHPF